MSDTSSGQPAGLSPVSSGDIAWETFEQGVKYGSRFKHLTRAVAGETYRVGVAIEELPPGRQSCPFHYHMLEEEHLLLLEGQCTLRLGEERLTLKAGDYICFPAGLKDGAGMRALERLREAYRT